MATFLHLLIKSLWFSELFLQELQNARIDNFILNFIPLKLRPLDISDTLYFYIQPSSVKYNMSNQVLTN